jgi:hypothetical protein
MTDNHGSTPAAGCCAPHPANAARVSLDGVAAAPRAVQPRRGGNTGKADLLVTGSLRTMDEAQPTAEAMAVAGGRILAVGSRSDLETFVGPGTTLLEHPTGVVMPGFVEPHLHLMTSALVFDGVDCSPYTNNPGGGAGRTQGGGGQGAQGAGRGRPTV